MGDSSVNAAENSITTIVAEPHITITEPLKRPYYLDFVVNIQQDVIITRIINNEIQIVRSF
jgi:hypothetical protein